MIKFSIIITCYNREKFISKCIRSALNQINISKDEYEVIVVDDNSHDDSGHIIKDFVPTIKFIKNKKNLGIASSRNVAIRRSKGKYLVMIDSDDYVSNNFLEIMGFYLDNNQYWDAVACDYFKVRNDGDVIKRFNFKKTPIACGILFRRKVIFNLGLYNKRLRINEEKDLRERFLKKNYTMGYVELPLYRYVMHEDNITKKINE
jgi:glycosyltransferase involved in cell wall biosynthesis